MNGVTFSLKNGRVGVIEGRGKVPEFQCAFVDRMHMHQLIHRTKEQNEFLGKVLFGE